MVGSQHALERWRTLSATATAVLVAWATGCESTNDAIAIARPQGVAGEGSSTGADGRDDCPGPASATEGVVTLYPFDGEDGRTQVRDLIGGHNGSVQLGVVTTVAGPDGCGTALAFGENGQYIVIDDSPAWDLDVGSVDFWLWLPAEQSDHMGNLLA